MTDLTPESPAVRLYTVLHGYEPTEIDTTQSLLGFFNGQNLDLLAAEHEKIVSERLAAVVAERDAAITERDRLRRALLLRLFENDKYLAALTWCGGKGRETFLEDVEYFKNNCLSLPGLTDFLVNHVTGRALNPEQPE